jgi:hypothetical protein
VLLSKAQLDLLPQIINRIALIMSSFDYNTRVRRKIKQWYYNSDENLNKAVERIHKRAFSRHLQSRQILFRRQENYASSEFWHAS